MKTQPINPTVKLVEDASRQFDEINGVVERGLADLFAHYRSNRDESHVLLKVVALNRLYSTGILAVHQMAQQICGMADEVDLALVTGAPEIVDRIARLRIGSRSINFYSFATKFCSWHEPEHYPIYDARVENYLWSMKKTGQFSSQHFAQRSDLYDYPKFLAIMVAFRDQFGVAQFSFKTIDKFLWSQGGPDTSSDNSANADSVAGGETSRHVADLEATAEGFFRDRAARAGKGLQPCLDMVPDVPPEPGDELPEGWGGQ